jgi:hypothetical protein
LTHPPVDSDHLYVFVQGTQVTPSAVNTSTTNPAFTLSTPPGTTDNIFTFIQTNAPGTS